MPPAPNPQNKVARNSNATMGRLPLTNDHICPFMEGRLPATKNAPKKVDEKIIIQWLLNQRKKFCLFVLFVLILYVPSTIFQLNSDGSSWVESVLSYDKCVLLKDHNAVTPVRLEPAAPRSRVKHSTSEPLRFLKGRNTNKITIASSICRRKQYKHNCHLLNSYLVSNDFAVC